MPTRARRPSVLTHSCSFEYRSSLGYTGPPPLRLIEWQLGDRPLDRPAADLDRDGLAGFGAHRGNESEPDAIPHRRAKAPARHPADRPPVQADGKPVARNRPLAQGEPYQAAGDPLALLPFEGGGTDNLAPAEFDGPP